MKRLKYAFRAAEVAQQSGAGYIWRSLEALRAGLVYPSIVSIQTDWSEISEEAVYTTIAPADTGTVSDGSGNSNASEGNAN